MADALDGQRRLVREVHHRVKNNLQVVASLLNIHGRTAETPEARAAYGAISRRVGALSIVHRNHFAEMEENRGIALRPLISELAAELRAGAPESARGLAIDLDLESVNTTQDVAVAVAFLVTEIIEFAMLRRADGTGRDVASPDQRADGASCRSAAPSLSPKKRTIRKRCSSSGSSPAWPSSCARPWNESSAATAWICLSFQHLEANRRSLRRRRKKVLRTSEPPPKTRRYCVRIVTFCPPALTIHLNGPGTANPPPPGGASGPSFVWAPLPTAVEVAAAVVPVQHAAQRANGSAGSPGWRTRKARRAAPAATASRPRPAASAPPKPRLRQRSRIAATVRAARA